MLDNYTFGNGLRRFRDTPDTFRANSNAVTAAVRYLHSPFGKPSYQVSLTAGYKSYNRIGNAGSVGLALTGVKRLGDGFDLSASTSTSTGATPWRLPTAERTRRTPCKWASS